MFANHREQYTNSTVRRVLTAAALFTAAASAQPLGAQTSASIQFSHPRRTSIPTS